MVADRWGWDIGFMLQTFGWKAALAVVFNATVAAFVFRGYLSQLPTISKALGKIELPWAVIGVHLALLVAVVVFSHRMVAFLGLFLLFLGIAEAYRRYQSRLILREGLLVGFFLAGLVVVGILAGLILLPGLVVLCSKQEWWLQPLLSELGTTSLYYGATALTAITDNAALTYLGSLVDGLSPEAKYSLVAGSVTGGGLTVIANAPNPAGFAILKGTFDDGAISPLWLAIAATPPTLVAIAAFRFLPG